MSEQTTSAGPETAHTGQPSLDPQPTRGSALSAHMLRVSRRRWRFVAFLAIGIAIVAALGRFTLGDGQTDHIGRVVISGVITTDAERLRELQAMAKDDHVKAVIVEINSPGGSTAGGEELYEALSALRAKKPVAITIDELGASAAYMTAIAGDRIFARRLSIVGSIGVLFQHVDAKKLLDTIGLDFQKVQTGPLKAEPDINDPLAGAVRDSLQALVDDSFSWFVDIVAERRDLPRSDVLTLADGRILTGQMAKKAGLIDDFGGIPEARNWLENEKGVAPDLPVLTHFPHPPSGWQALVGQAAAGVGQGLGQALGLSAASRNALDGLVALWHADPLNGQSSTLQGQ